LTRSKSSKILKNRHLAGIFDIYHKIFDIYQFSSEINPEFYRKYCEDSEKDRLEFGSISYSTYWFKNTICLILSQEKKLLNIYNE